LKDLCQMSDTPKKKRGRPRKNPVPEIPEEIQSIVDEVQEKQKLLEETINEFQE